MSRILLINTGKTQYVEGSLNWMTNGYYMFSGCSQLTSFNADLSSLTSGNYMFQSCENLASFNSDLPSLTTANSMFYGCSNLASFNSDLPSLTNGQYMFYDCDNLTSFSSDLSNLTTGSIMFGSSTSNCAKLDLASVQNIADTINDLTAQGKTGTINIGMAKTIQSNDETAPINVALATIRAKGWTVTEIYRS